MSKTFPVYHKWQVDFLSPWSWILPFISGFLLDLKQEVQIKHIPGNSFNCLCMIYAQSTSQCGHFIVLQWRLLSQGPKDSQDLTAWEGTWVGSFSSPPFPVLMKQWSCSRGTMEQRALESTPANQSPGRYVDHAHQAIHGHFWKLCV